MSAETLRLDKWLWFARLCKSRSLATKLCRAGGVRINKQVVEKPHYPLKIGDIVTASIGAGVRVLQVSALGERRGPAAEARLLYVDLSPQEPKTGSVTAVRSGERDQGTGRPTKRDRRDIDQLRGPCE